MFTSITLKFGSSQEQPPLTFEPGPMTVFVGPNNSGKSQMLRDVDAFLQSKFSPGTKFSRLIEDIHPKLLSEDDIRQLFSDESKVDWSDLSLPHEPKFRQYIPATGRRAVISHGYVSEIMQNRNFHEICKLISFYTISLDGKTRLELTEPAPTEDLQKPLSNLLMTLFRDDAARERLRSILYDAFGLYFVLDPTGISTLRIRMSAVPPVSLQQERSLDASAIEFFRRAIDISELSDGIRAFTGIMAAVLSANHRVILIDEPEAFLHPPLIARLGRKLTELASERQGHVLASTHSADFVMGCVQAGKSVNIIRLTFKQNIASARLLSASRLKEMMRNPFLRSSGVLGALFHEGAVICEADTDRAFYQEVNERLLEFGKGGISNCVFLNSNGKDTIRQLLQPLREIGIPAAAIVDLDVLKPGTLKPLLQAGFAPAPLVDTLEPKRAGVGALDKANKEAAVMLINNLAEYGIFVVPSGELEKWLTDLGVSRHGPSWLNQMFFKMGTDPADENYVSPGEGDVWAFLRNVAAWIANPLRKGMPD
jgi:hypothetical protein